MLLGGISLKSGYLYQMYAYIRPQEGLDPRWNRASGLFLHPAIDAVLYEHALIQNHLLAFATVDLARPTASVRRELRGILRSSVHAEKTACPSPQNPQ